MYKKNKFNARKTKIDGHTFDSKKEAARYSELKLMQRGGEIKYLQLQPKFTLLDGFCHDGKKIRAITYTADFMYFDCESGDMVVEDVKSKATVTDVYKIKRKLFLNRYGGDYKFKEVF